VVAGIGGSWHICNQTLACSKARRTAQSFVICTVQGRWDQRRRRSAEMVGIKPNGDAFYCVWSSNMAKFGLLLRLFAL
jgi:hypothetical protein